MDAEGTLGHVEEAVALLRQIRGLDTFHVFDKRCGRRVLARGLDLADIVAARLLAHPLQHGVKRVVEWTRPTDECQSAIGFEDHEAVGPGGVGHAGLVVHAVDEQLASDALAGEEVHRQLGPLGEARCLLDLQIPIHRPLISRVGLPHVDGDELGVVLEQLLGDHQVVHNSRKRGSAAAAEVEHQELGGVEEVVDVTPLTLSRVHHTVGRLAALSQGPAATSVKAHIDPDAVVEGGIGQRVPHGLAEVMSQRVGLLGAQLSDALSVGHRAGQPGDLDAQLSRSGSIRLCRSRSLLPAEQSLDETHNALENVALCQESDHNGKPDDVQWQVRHLPQLL
mmetsp:Transcript_26943/g.67105  ORF Transcript_26943/g.67105 Transcript_26943/m.67105 type:complete len:337 (+) Transcript_26943:1174-2184(+)